MARRQFVLALLLLALPLAFVFVMLFHASPQIGLSPMKQEKTTTVQMRTGVRKELFMTQADGSRLEILLLSDRSRLHILPQAGHRTEVIEELENMSCAFQEKVYTASNGERVQQVRTAVAEKGTYTYATGELVAQKVHLGLFRSPGHTLSLPITGTPLMKGIADKVSLRLAHGTPRFDAEALAAQLFTAGTP